ncbi:MAG TPA: CBS domain-containing protein, partial [Candidatus Faecousia intestinavium]|nr:CBS domain-containing protein [Candidatus Faecousia intestinavium]
FIPVVDDYGAFIGIITRKAIIKYCYDQLFPED